MKKHIKERIKKEVCHYIKDWKEIGVDLPVPPCEPKHNSQCMNNCMNEYKARRSFAIVEVVSRNYGVVHYLCVDENGNTYDPTLGFEWSGHKYKVRRYIHPESGVAMDDQLDSCKRELYQSACSRLTRLLAKIFFIDYNSVI
jgi:hypothetical protein